MTTGLTLGKFAPLHRGHQLLFETALRETDHLIALIYPTDIINVPLGVRANWIRTLYPSVEVIEAWDGPAESGYTPEITSRHDAYIRSRLNGRTITHFFSSEPYGEHVSRALDAIDRRVDMDRLLVPVSGTAIRLDPYAHRHSLEPVVYRDLVARVAFVGAPSTGKTTLCEALSRRFDTTWMPEYGREYFERHHAGRRITIEQLVELAEGHRRLEDERVLDANRFLFVDTEAMITRLFSLYFHDRCDERLERLADDSATRYDLFFLCEDDIPYADTPDRSGEANRAAFQTFLRNDLARRKIPYITVRGTLHDRSERVAHILNRFVKYASVAGCAI